ARELTLGPGPRPTGPSALRGPPRPGVAANRAPRPSEPTARPGDPRS
ncbi:MAG: hypothetical protein QOE27_136, partial [Solirubrobacteraceae bacterium]|nr:hypothetical protein [Solirubrobacteraceae bacterium]